MPNTDIVGISISVSFVFHFTATYDILFTSGTKLSVKVILHHICWHMCHTEMQWKPCPLCWLGFGVPTRFGSFLMREEQWEQ